MPHITLPDGLPGISEAEAYLRITVARASREHPMLLMMLGDGRLHLTGIAKLAPRLTRENREALLKRATHRSKRQIEELVAEIAPRPDVPALTRKLPERTPRSIPTPSVVADPVPPTLPGLRPAGVALLAVATNSAPSAVVQPLAPARFKVQFTATVELRDKLERLRALMRSRVRDGDLAAIIEHAVTEKLERLEARRFARTATPRKSLPGADDLSPSSRSIPAAVKRAVCERDGSRCRYVDKQGQRCPERNQLEFHHHHPFGLGGGHSLQNIRLMCRAHNLYAAERDYGRGAMAWYRRSRHGVPEEVVANLGGGEVSG